MTPIYLGNWECKEDMIADFSNVLKPDESCKYPPGSKEHMRWLNDKDKYEAAINSEEYKGNILLASYETGNWEGEAFVLLEKEGKLYEINASHCSCYGLEDQWSPEETTVDELNFRLTKGTFGRSDWNGKIENTFANELNTILNKL